MQFARHPPRIVRRTARKGEGRAFWLEVLATGKGVDEIFTPTVKALPQLGQRPLWRRVSSGSRHTPQAR